MAAQYRDPKWQRVRLKCLEESEWKCSACGTDKDQLQVHHKRYIKGRKVWEYDYEELVVLCERCHGIEHFFKDIVLQMVADCGPQGFTNIAPVIAGFLFGQYDVHNSVAFFPHKLNPTLFKEMATSKRLGMSSKVYEKRVCLMLAEAEHYSVDMKKESDA